MRGIKTLLRPKGVDGVALTEMLTQREIIACCSRSKEKEPKARKDRYETT